MTVMTRRNNPRRNPACSVTFVTALISMTQRIAPPRHRCQKTLHIPRTMAAGVRSGLTVRSARCLGTGQPTATTTRLSEAGRGPQPAASHQHRAQHEENSLFFDPSTNLRKYFDLQHITLSFPLISKNNKYLVGGLLLPSSVLEFEDFPHCTRCRHSCS